MNKRIYLCLAHMSGQEQKYIQEAFDTNWVVPLGPNVNQFEEDLRSYVTNTDRCAEGVKDIDRKRVVALSAGTAAIHLALVACGVKAGDEVCVQSFTFCASVNPIKYLGAIPILIDSEKDTWNMDPELLEQAIVDRKQKTGKYPKAIIVVALYGMPYRIEEIMAVAGKYNIPVIEDAAEGLGSRYKGQVLGTFGQYGVLSFNGNKMITTSGGGALICPNEEEWNRVMWYATQARDAYPYYQHTEIGYNYRMSNICAGIGRGQMTVLDEHIRHHQHVQALYENLLKDITGISVHKAPNDSYESNYWLCTITINSSVHILGEDEAYSHAVNGVVGGAAGVTRDTAELTTTIQPNANIEALRVYLDKAGIEARPLWKPMHCQPVYADAPRFVNGISEELFQTGMCLPSGPMVSEEDVKYIVDTIKKAMV